MGLRQVGGVRSCQLVSFVPSSVGPQFGNVNGVQVPRGCLFGALKGLILYCFGFKFGMQLEYTKQD